MRLGPSGEALPQGGVFSSEGVVGSGDFLKAARGGGQLGQGLIHLALQRVGGGFAVAGGEGLGFEVILFLTPLLQLRFVLGSLCTAQRRFLMQLAPEFVGNHRRVNSSQRDLKFMEARGSNASGFRRARKWRR